MPKKGMKRIARTHTQPRNTVPPVPEIQGKAKSGREKANLIIAGTKAPSQKVYHGSSHKAKEKPISSVYTDVDTDLARDNLENDISAADLQDM